MLLAAAGGWPGRDRRRRWRKLREVTCCALIGGYDREDGGI
jgi:hypothetical protein